MIPERKNDPIVICGFPGVGKTHFAKDMTEHEHRDDIIDLESSPFKAKDANHPRDYCEAIAKAYLSGCYSYIFTSCHKEVRTYLWEHHIPYIIVMPQYYKDNDAWMTARDEYMKRYLSRGNSGHFIQKIYDNWQDWMEEMLYQDPAPKIQLRRYSFIDEIFDYSYELDDKSNE